METVLEAHQRLVVPYANYTGTCILGPRPHANSLLDSDENPDQALVQV